MSRTGGIEMSLEEEINKMSIEKLRSTLLITMQDNAAEDTQIREAANTILSDFDCYGDSYGVPALLDIVCTLIARIKRLEESK
jgi:hypothetical protein